MDDLMAERLDHLEHLCNRLARQNRRWKLVGITALMGAVLFLVAGANQNDETPKVVEAQKFVLRDKEGKQRAVLEVSSKGAASLHLSDKDETPRIAFIVAEDGSPIATLQDEQGQSRVSFASSKIFGGSVVNLMDPDGKVRLGLAVRDRGGVPTLDLRDKDANRRINLGVRPDGSSTFDILGEDESPRLRLSLSRDLPNLLLFDKDVKPRLGLVVSPTGLVGLDIFAQDKRMSVGLEKAGQMNLRIVGEDGKALFQIPEP